MNIKENINSLFNEVLNASVSSVKETSHVPASKSAVHKPASKAKKAPEKARKHNSRKDGTGCNGTHAVAENLNP